MPILRRTSISDVPDLADMEVKFGSQANIYDGEAGGRVRRYTAAISKSGSRRAMNLTQASTIQLKRCNWVKELEIGSDV